MIERLIPECPLRWDIIRDITKACALDVLKEPQVIYRCWRDPDRTVHIEIKKPSAKELDKLKERSK